ncbi:MAG: hypothetical protein NXI04_12790 [Planctomycetaceae bacterium]|nr:hypothetical protein [Planctomycetaceae bacterium]
MKRLLILVMLSTLPSAACAQQIDLKDLQRAARALQNGGRIQIGGPIGGPQIGAPITGGPGANKDESPPPQYKFRSDPNASGNHNHGRFDPDHFFNPGGSGGYRPPSGGGYPQPGYPQPGYRPQDYPQGNPQQGLRPQYQDSGSRYKDPPLAPRRKYSGQPIQLECWSGSQGVCPYELITAAGSAFKYNMTAGMNQQLAETTLWSLRYRPTASAPWQTYRLRGGRSYQLRGDGGRWQLYMLP